MSAAGAGWLMTETLRSLASVSRFIRFPAGAPSHQHALLNGADRAPLVEKCADRGPDAVRPVARLRANADPVAVGDPEHVHREVGVEECPLGDVQLAADAVGAVGHREQSLQRGHGLALDEVDGRLDPGFTRALA